VKGEFSETRKRTRLKRASPKRIGVGEMKGDEARGVEGREIAYFDVKRMEKEG